MKEATEHVPINPNSTIADDLLTIFHHPRTSKIAVHFRPDSRCTHPYLMGRLSGPLLSMVSWDRLEPPANRTANHTASNRIRVATGRYRVPRGGHYFLEILVIICKPVAEGTCLEDPGRHRLTAKGAAIWIDAEEDRTTAAGTTVAAHHTWKKPAAVGYWYNTLANASDHEPLYTRYQPPHCRSPLDKTARCRPATDLSRFAPYRFAFGHANLTRDSLRERLRKFSRNPTVCFVGASHASVLNKTTGSLLEGVATVARIEVRHADEFGNWHIGALVGRNCTKVVFGTGQWDAGWPRRYLTPFAEYERALSGAARLLIAAGRQHPMDVVIRQTHYNPIGDMMQCQPGDRDWRNPAVIDRYNAISRAVCHLHDLPFLDTGAIMSPVWDSAEDWCHYKDQDSKEAEALYLLDRLFF